MKRRQPPDEPALVNTRTDADSYADTVLSSLRRGLRRLSEREQGIVRDALREAYLDGECQGECRAIVIFTIAQQRAAEIGDRDAIAAGLKILLGMDDV